MASSKNQTSVWRNILAGLTAVILALGLTVVAATSAQAHAGNLHNTVTCNTDTGLYEVEQTIGWTSVPNNGAGTIETRTGTSSFSNGWNHSTFNDWVTLTTTSGSSGTYSWSYTLPGNTTSAPWVYVFITWADGYTGQQKYDDRPEGLAGDCAVPTPKDATASVVVSDATCDAPGSPTFSIEHATWADAINTDGNNWSRTATADSGHRFTDGTTTTTVTYTIPPKLDANSDECIQPATPVTPVVVQPICEDGLPVEGTAPTFEELVTLQPTGVIVTLNDGSTTDGTFSAADGFYLTSGSATTFSLKLDPTPSALDCAVADATAKYSVTQATCTAGQQLIYSESDAVNAVWNAQLSTPSGTNGPTSFSITADANPGHKFADVQLPTTKTTDNGTLSTTFTGTLSGKLTGAACAASLALTGMVGPFGPLLNMFGPGPVFGGGALILAMLVLAVIWWNRRFNRKLALETEGE